MPEKAGVNKDIWREYSHLEADLKYNVGSIGLTVIASNLTNSITNLSWSMVFLIPYFVGEKNVK